MQLQTSGGVEIWKKERRENKTFVFNVITESPLLDSACVFSAIIRVCVFNAAMLVFVCVSAGGKSH